MNWTLYSMRMKNCWSWYDSEIIETWFEIHCKWLKWCSKAVNDELKWHLTFKHDTRLSSRLVVDSCIRITHLIMMMRMRKMNSMRIILKTFMIFKQIMFHQSLKTFIHVKSWRWVTWLSACRNDFFRSIKNDIDSWVWISIDFKIQLIKNESKFRLNRMSCNSVQC